MTKTQENISPDTEQVIKYIIKVRSNIPHTFDFFLTHFHYKTEGIEEKLSVLPSILQIYCRK